MNPIERYMRLLPHCADIQDSAFGDGSRARLTHQRLFVLCVLYQTPTSAAVRLWALEAKQNQPELYATIRRLGQRSAIGRILRAVWRQGLIERIEPAPRVCEWHPSPELKRVIRRYVRRSR